MKIIEVVNALERFAPLPLQEDYDNAGLQVGLTEAEVSGALLCLDVTDAVVDDALEKDCNLIVSHHPLIFHKLGRIADENYVQRIVRKVIEKRVTVVSMHTNMDEAYGGVNFKIAEKIGLEGIDFFGGRKIVSGINGGEGVVGCLKMPLAADDFLLMLKKKFDVECVMANELLRKPIKRVAVCGGAGDFLLENAIKANADAFVTGEMHYHQFFGHEQEIQIAVLGHYQSEQYTMEIFRDIIEKECRGVRCVITSINTNPILYI